jgi:UDP-N-acetylglucosamine 2-epimerase (non-hydrolysing)
MPEEINRIVTDQLAARLFTPSPDAGENLMREGVPSERIVFVGNVMIDTLIRLLPAAEARWCRLHARLGDEQYVLATLHRPSNVDDPRTLGEIVLALRDIAGELPVVFPVHPRTRERISGCLPPPGHPGLRLLEPLGYVDFLALTCHAALVITDSGGIQEETTFLGVPCLTVRPNTERPITIERGTNRLVEGKRERLRDAARRALASATRASRSRPCPPEMWDGRAAGRIADIMERLG